MHSKEDGVEVLTEKRFFPIVNWVKSAEQPEKSAELTAYPSLQDSFRMGSKNI
jgi:hypothetical protein